MPARTIDRFLADLHDLPPAAVTSDRVLDRIAGGTLDEASLRPFTRPKAGGGYARNLIERSPLFDVILVVWEPGAQTPVHDHAGQLGWVRLVRGAVREETWDADAPGTTLRATGDATVADVGAVATVDRVRCIHRISNPGADRAVTLHVYSKPHDTCRVFALDGREPRTRTLRFDSVPDGAAALGS